MANLNAIQITTCDNELYVVAITPAGSTELLHLKSGYNKLVDTTIFPGAILAAGTYDIQFIGIDWGGAVGFGGTLYFDNGISGSFKLKPATSSIWVFDAGPVSIVNP